jgi:simple sugar transport system permease protein
MTEPIEPGGAEPPELPQPTGGDYAPSVAERLSFYQRAGGLVTPILTAVLAFFIGGLVVLATGHNPLQVYRGILSGTGLDFFIHFGHHSIDIPFTNHHVFFWWDTASNAAFNLQQTLLTATTLALTGLSVAFAFRCGLFNIGGQGQYIVGAMTGVWVGSSFVTMNSAAHILLAIGLAMAAAALWGAIAGLL